MSFLNLYIKVKGVHNSIVPPKNHSHKYVQLLKLSKSMSFTLPTVTHHEDKGIANIYTNNFRIQYPTLPNSSLYIQFMKFESS